MTIKYVVVKDCVKPLGFYSKTGKFTPFHWEAKKFNSMKEAKATANALNKNGGQYFYYAASEHFQLNRND